MYQSSWITNARHNQLFLTHNFDVILIRVTAKLFKVVEENYKEITPLL